MEVEDRQLATLKSLRGLLGTAVNMFRTTQETPPRVSAIDVVAALTGYSSGNAARLVNRMRSEHPDMAALCTLAPWMRAPERTALKGSPACDARGAVELIMFCPCQLSTNVRRQAAELVMRYLGADSKIVSEVCALRGFHGEVAVSAAGGARRGRGSAVGVAPGSSGSTGDGLQQMISALEGRLTGEICEKIKAFASEQRVALARIQERLDQDRSCESREARGTKRTAPYEPRSAREPPVVKWPFPCSRFTDNNGRAESAWTTPSPHTGTSSVSPPTRALACSQLVSSEEGSASTRKGDPGPSPIVPAPVHGPRHRLEGMDSVVRAVVKKCKGGNFTSKGVNVAIRNLKFTHESRKGGAEIVAEALRQLSEGGLVEAVKGDAAPRRGRKVREFRWKSWGDIKGDPRSNAIRARLGLGQGDFV